MPQASPLEKDSASLAPDLLPHLLPPPSPEVAQANITSALNLGNITREAAAALTRLSQTNLNLVVRTLETSAKLGPAPKDLH